MHRSTLFRASTAAFGSALILTSLAAVQTEAATTHSTSSKSTATPYLVSAVGYASRVVGGHVPVNSDQTAFAVLSCTNRAGLERTNAKADVTLPGGIGLSNIKTRTWTTKTGGTVSSHGRHYIERVTLVSSALGSLYIDGVVSNTRAWHNRSGFHSAARADLADIVFDSILTGPRHIRLPLPGKSVTIPGLATISLAVGGDSANAAGARASMDAIKLHVIPTDTTVYLAHSAAAIQAGAIKAIYKGSAFGLKAQIAGGLVSSQRTPSIPTPCLGSGGAVRSRDVAELAPGTGIHASALRATTQSGKDARGRNFVTNGAKVAGVDLGNGLHVNAINARAHIHKAGHRYVKNSKGTTLGSITLDGQKVQIPKSGVLEIPGVAKLETNLVTTTRTSITVTTLRVTLLDGRLGVVNIGYARSALVPRGI